MIATILIVSGILALIALLMPSSIIIGLIFGILPGFLLALAPAVFGYTAAFAVIRHLLPFGGPGLRSASAAALTVALGFLLAAPANLRGRQAYAAALRPDVTPSATLPLHGHVLLTRSNAATSTHPDLGIVPACDALCLSLLDTPGVRSVTLSGVGRSGAAAHDVTYALVDKAAVHGPTVKPSSPEEIFQQLPDDLGPATGDELFRRARQAQARRTAYAADWAVRTATRQSIVASEPRGPHDFAIAIREDRSDGPANVWIRELEVRDSGRVLLRRQLVSASPLMPLLLPLPTFFGDKRVKWDFGRTSLSNTARYADFQPIRQLFEQTNLARPATADDPAAELRDALAAAVHDPHRPASDEAFTLVQPWFKTLDWANLADADLDLLAAVIADPRIRDLSRMYDGAFRHASPRLRDAAATRLLDPDASHEVLYSLNALIRNMPAGTYAKLTRTELKVLSQGATRPNAAALIERMADQGAAATPDLVKILEADATLEPWFRRKGVMEAVTRAFVTLGPEAGVALPLVLRLFDQQRSPIMQSWREARNWRVAMLRMGLPLDDIPFPPNQSEEGIAKDRADLASLAERIGAGEPLPR